MYCKWLKSVFKTLKATLRVFLRSESVRITLKLVYRPVYCAFTRSVRCFQSVMRSCLRYFDDMPEESDKKCFEYLVGPTKDILKCDVKFYSICTTCKAAKKGFKSSDALDGIEANENIQSLFVAKREIPTALFQQTYRQWKASQDMLWRIRLMRTKRLIVVQPLEIFPQFIDDFEFSINNGKSRGFFNFLQKFLEVFFFGFAFELRTPTTMESIGWNITTR